MLTLAAIGVVFWVSCMIIPHLYAPGTMIHLDGRIGSMDHMDIWETLDPVSGFFYGFGDIICHQEEARTAISNGNERFICIRDYNLLLGAIIGLLGSVAARKDYMGGKWTVICAVLILLTPVEWMFEHICDIDLATVRGVCAVLTGGALGIMLAYLVHRRYESFP